jgi:hypothetical protein
MPVALYNNNNSPVLLSPFSNSLGGITSKYESRGGGARRKSSKKSKKTKKTRKSRKARK